MKLTEKQHQAVYERGKSVLVSAAAGSGKTSVLSERIAILCEEGADIRNMLVCTFTNLAAAEMRSRISQKLLLRAEETNDLRLRAQAEYAASADICTFHSFSIRLLRENFLKAGLPQRWRVASEYTAAQLKEKALEDTFQLLTEEKNEDMRLLLRRFADKNERNLKRQLLRLYDFTRSLPEQLEWIVRYDRETALEKCRKLYLQKYDGIFSRMMKSYERCAEISRQEGWEKQLEKDEKELSQAKEIHAAYLSGDFKRVQDLLGTIKTIARDRKIPDGDAKDEHKFFKDDAREKKKSLAGISSDDLNRLSGEESYMRRQAEAFYRVLKVFDEILREEKTARGILDYDDIICRTYALLCDEETAAEYRKNYEYVFVDEYQDTNPIQDAVIEKISREDNLFLVGDMKQSIYRFRLADPLIFREKQERYARAEEAGMLIRMNDNFRSAPQVIAGINHAMTALMSRTFGEIDYDEEEALRAGAEGMSGQTEFLLTIERDSPMTAAEQEAASIAKKIREFHAAGTAYADIAVLLRSVKTEGEIFAEVFRHYGIPFVNNVEREVPAEVELFLNLLRVVDNVNSDIALISVMRGQIGGFNEQELAEIRAIYPHGSYYSALKEAAEQETVLGEKCGEFLRSVKLLRIYSRSMRLTDFLIYLKNRTRFEERITLLPHGPEKAEVFRNFFEECLAEAGEKESLYQLICEYDARIRRGDSMIGKKESFGTDGCVRIMTVHASKGLEFPVVFFARLGKKANESDLADTLLFTSELGIVSDIIDEDLRFRKKSMLKEVMKDTIEGQLRSELLRVVYVAMTRAKTHLILSGTLAEKNLDAALKQAMNAKKYGVLQELKTPLAWMIAAYSEETLLDWPGIHLTTVRELPMDEEVSSEKHPLTDAWERVKNMAGGAELSHYQPDLSPIKYSVSSLMPVYIQENLPETAPQYTGTGGTEFGSLVHFFMEHADFGAFEGVERQLERMLRTKLITEEEATLLRKFQKPIERFFAGKTAERIRRAGKVYREMPFNLSISAKELGKAGAGDLVVQGIIDLIFEENGKWVIVDYKSNFVTAENRAELTEHYAVQMRLYRRAAEMITRKPVSESILCFLRAGMEERILF